MIFKNVQCCFKTEIFQEGYTSNWHISRCTSLLVELKMFVSSSYDISVNDCFNAATMENGKHFEWMSVDLSKYGIEKPKLRNIEETVEGNADVIDIGFIPLLKSGRVELVNKGGVQRFDGDDVVMENGERLNGYDVVVLCTFKIEKRASPQRRLKDFQLFLPNLFHVALHGNTSGYSLSDL